MLVFPPPRATAWERLVASEARLALLSWENCPVGSQKKSHTPPTGTREVRGFGWLPIGQFCAVSSQQKPCTLLAGTREVWSFSRLPLGQNCQIDSQGKLLPPPGLNILLHTCHINLKKCPPPSPPSALLHLTSHSHHLFLSPRRPLANTVPDTLMQTGRDTLIKEMLCARKYAQSNPVVH